MSISVWTRDANPAIDPPTFNTPREVFEFWVSCGRAQWLANRRGKVTYRRGQMLADHRLDFKPVKPAAGYADVSNLDHPALVWVPMGAGWQMRDCYGSMARHFRDSRTGLNYAPNTTTSPSRHIDVVQ